MGEKDRNKRLYPCWWVFHQILPDQDIGHLVRVAGRAGHKNLPPTARMVGRLKVPSLGHQTLKVGHSKEQSVTSLFLFTSRDKSRALDLKSEK